MAVTQLSWEDLAELARVALLPRNKDSARGRRKAQRQAEAVANAFVSDGLVVVRMPPLMTASNGTTATPVVRVS